MHFGGRAVAHTSVVGRDTRIVIEGLHRSGNTFAFVAFQVAQEAPVPAAHHLHAEAQIIEGVRRRIPVMLLVRQPDDLVVSYSASFGLPLRVALRDYVTFYGRLLPYRYDVVVAPFEEVTSDFSTVIERVNTRYGTSFRPFRHTPDNVERCFSIIREFYERTAPEPDRTIAFPSDRRRELKESLRAEFYAHRHKPLREEAFRIYRRFQQAGVHEPSTSIAYAV